MALARLRGQGMLAGSGWTRRTRPSSSTAVVTAVDSNDFTSREARSPSPVPGATHPRTAARSAASSSLPWPLLPSSHDSGLPSPAPALPLRQQLSSQLANPLSSDLPDALHGRAAPSDMPKADVGRSARRWVACRSMVRRVLRKSPLNPMVTMRTR